ncbi:hypothetical protein KKH39_01705 [Patescibacteria group bacterium]|nr:hypothetical protein [Patescibacteria group bacterium]
MKNHKKTKAELVFWKGLTNFWGIITSLIFLLTFFKIWDMSYLLTDITIIYLSILSIFTGVKEYSRWKNKDFFSRYNGEIFIVTWTILMLIFIVISAIDKRYQLYSQFTATYLSILGVFAISLKSKSLKNK